MIFNDMPEEMKKELEQVHEVFSRVDKILKCLGFNDKLTLGENVFFQTCALLECLHILSHNDYAPDDRKHIIELISSLPILKE